MKKHFTHENFERFLKESADDLQMRPSADVWSRIEGRMNRRRRRVFFSSAFFLLTASLFGYLIIEQSKNAADPFAGVQTLSKKTDAKPANITTNPATTDASLQRASTAKPRLTVASVTKNPVNASTSVTREQLGSPIVPENSNASVVGVPSPFTPTVVDEQQPFSNTAPETRVEQETAKNEIPTIESVVNSYSPKRVKRKPEFQLFFTPTVSYRRLTENKSYLRAVPQSMATFNIAALYDVNSMVTHKPDMGLELGFAFKLPVTGRIKLRTGMQFNITRYDIKAFTSYRPERATIALNTRSRGVDSVATLSNYRNGSGGRADWLQNFYFQVSAPVGVEVSLSNNKKTQFGVAGSVQPTYVLGDRAYLISSDYKNYSQVPWLIRRWNVNTSLETFVSYSTGKLRWQVGPQVRYQLLSSFVEKYPVKENLFDYGLKIGVSLDKK
jgi:hypothetical protein